MNRSAIKERLIRARAENDVAMVSRCCAALAGAPAALTALEDDLAFEALMGPAVARRSRVSTARLARGYRLPVVRPAIVLQTHMPVTKDIAASRATTERMPIFGWDEVRS